MALKAHILLTDGQRLAGCYAQLHLHEIKAGDRLGNRMLDLQARVHLHEVERARAVEQKLERARAFIGDRPYRRRRRFAHPRTQFRRDRGRWRFFDELLMPTLDRAVPFSEMNRGAVAISEHLNLDMARIDDRPFEDHARVVSTSATRSPHRPRRRTHCHTQATLGRRITDDSDCG